MNKKADSVPAKPQADDELLKPAETKNAYTFFNLPGKVRRKRHSWDETVPDTNIHPTVVTFREKRIAGVSVLNSNISNQRQSNQIMTSFSVFDELFVPEKSRHR